MSIVTEERLQHELLRVKKRLAREKQTEEEAAIKSARSRLAKARSHLDFVRGQTAERLQQSIDQNQNKQVQLASQIEQLRKWERFYCDMLTNHDSILAEARSQVEVSTRRLGELTGEIATPENMNEQFAKLMAMIE